jgi:amidase
MPVMTRRELIPLGAAALMSACVRPNSDHGPYRLLDVPLGELAAGLHPGRFTSRGLVRWYLDRIDSLDRRGPKLNAILELNPQALAEAEKLDAELRGRGPRSALHGVPVLIKDNIDTAGAMMTTIGSLALDGWHGPADDDSIAIEDIATPVMRVR